MRSVMAVMGNLLRVAAFPLWWALRGRRPRGGWVRVRVERRLLPVTPRMGRLQRVLRRNLPGGATSLWALGELTRAIARDARSEGLLLQVPRLDAGWAACQSLRDRIAALARAGKRVVVFLPEGGGHREAFVASAATRVVLSPGAQLQLTGLSSQTPYLRPLLDRWGLEPQLQAVGDYKTAGEQFARAEMSEHQREQVTAILSTTQQALVGGLAERPALDETSASELFERGLFHAGAAIDAGLADAALYEDGLAAEIGEQAPVEAGSYQAWSGARLWQPVSRQRHVAVVPIRGTIAVEGAPLGRGASLDRTVARLRAVAKDRAAVGAILMVDSPGGSALASDLIHHEVERLAASKAMVACFGEVAASGGYYVAAGAARIVAQPQTVTGSIGVVSGKLVASALLAQLGVSLETLSAAPHADMFGIGRRWSEEEGALLADELAAIYQRFLEVVARGRGRPVAEVEGWASGRVWSGQAALSLGMVDRLGGLDEAMEEVRGLLTDLPAQARERLRPVWVQAPPGHPPPLPPAAPGSPTDAAAGELTALRQLLTSGERALCYAPGLPRPS